jgi:hypothetical protein
MNFEQPINDWIGLFGRWGWNERQHESYAYTEVDQTWQLGVGENGLAGAANSIAWVWFLSAMASAGTTRNIWPTADTGFCSGMAN